MTSSIRKHFVLAPVLFALFTFPPATAGFAQSVTDPSVLLGQSKASPKDGTVSAARLRVPDKAKRLVEKAQNELARGQEEKSLEHLMQALAVAPDYSQALATRGIIKLVQDHPGDALTDFELAIHADPKDGLAYLVMGCALNKLLRYRDAVPYLERSSEFFPSSWLAAFELSRSHLANHEYEKALQQANRATSLKPDDRGRTSLHAVRGYSLLGLKRYDEASAEFKMFLAAVPDSKLSPVIRKTLSGLKTRNVPHSEEGPPMGATPRR